MIVPMKKVTLLALGTEQDEALTALRGLGVMQVETIRSTASENAQQLAEELSEATRITGELEKLLRENGGATPQGKPRSGAEALEEAADLLGKRDRFAGELENIRQRQKALAVWGEFNRDTLTALEEKGIHVHLCCGNEKQYEAATALDEVECRSISEDSGRIFFVATTLRDLEPDALPEIRLGAEDNPPELRRRAGELELKLQAVGEELNALLASLPAAQRRVQTLESELEYARVHDSLAEHGAVVSLSGFVPEPEIEKLRAAAREHGWGLLITDPAPGDAVPTLLRESKFSRVISPLFQFLGISPGYDEIDVSGGVLVFFTIFYAMIIGDAGYGLVFLLGTLLAKWKFRNNRAAALPLRLMTVLSIAAIVWGVLTNNYFGTAPLPRLSLRFFTQPDVKDANVQAFCFALAVAQLSLGRIWRAIHDGNLRSVGRNLGWMLILWGNFFLTLRLIVWPGEFPTYMYWLYGAGLVLVICCDINWKNVADIFQFPFNIIGSFVDVLSYIRLFAVGMAGYYIAASFNGMGVSIWKASPYFLLFGVLVILFGHLLNLGLCALSVLVHGVRLNTLEFSNHVGLSWSGSNFKPFTNHKKSEEN